MRYRQRTLLPILFVALFFVARLSAGQDGELILDRAMHHLGDDPTPDWTEAPEQPEGGRLEFDFDGRSNDGEWTLKYRQRNVNNTWRVLINGREVIVLRRFEELLDVVAPIPAGMLVDGPNTFVLEGDTPTDDITFGNISISTASLRESLHLRPVRVRVTDAAGGPSPARITIANGDGELAPVYYADALHQATRDGVVYTDAGEARFEVAEGDYTIYATRGSEWSLATAAVSVGADPIDLSLAIERVVDTTGFVACDTHIHTLTFSGHGDSSVEERMVTLAGEGVELAISTDHNHNTDYVPYQARMELNEFFTPVVGNEVTTAIGHFNAFPLDPEEEVPAYKVDDVVTLVDGIRAKGAQVVILNHPRWPDHERGPFGVIELSHFTGANNLHWTYPFDAVELINSCTEEESPMLLFEDWFALLNRGERVSAVGSSDSHTVGDPVGGGRTYVASSTDDPAAIDVDEACRAIVAGRTSISMGIFLDTSVSVSGSSERYTMGDLVPLADAGGVCDVRLRIAAPEWIRPERATLFVNGRPAEELDLAQHGAGNGAMDAEVTVTLSDGLGEDAWLVWVVIGSGIDGPFWPLHNDYTLGATNPVFLDVNGDGAYQSPRESARKLVHAAGSDRQALIVGLREASQAVAIQALDLVRVHYETGARERLRDVGASAGAAHTRIDEYLESLAEIR